MKLRREKAENGGVIIDDFQTPHNMPKKESWAKRHKFPLIIISSVLGVAIIVALSLLVFMPSSHEKILGADDGDDVTNPDIVYYSHLTGREVANKASETQAATCIMIENSPDARPQSGLKDAGVIYEAIAEGGITRFMAIYQESKPNFIGPVRSVRLYYAHWAKPYNCSIAHAGGASDALALIRNVANGYRDIDEFQNSSAYWRQSGRYAPHNLYTSFERLDKLNTSKGYISSIFEGFERLDADDAPAIPDKTVSNITIKMSSALYNPVYTYDAETNTYLRSHQSGGKHFDKAQDGSLKQYAPSTVVAIGVQPVSRPDSAYANYTTTGSGTAYVFQNGSVVEGKWSRPTVDDELKLLDGNGNVILLNRGQTWISAYPNNSGSVSWN
ncbi:MAG: DUF3048 domain-containing protein [Candidatus Nomurabacteria bacterium]|jgi:hypothetical protein|nr:DUF3048 domain-containing protein [Candidatus Nomurabacteria bacterium]